jgi:hypothetical protein
MGKVLLDTEIWDSLSECSANSKYLFLWLKTNPVSKSLIGNHKIPSKIIEFYTGLSHNDVNKSIDELVEKGIIFVDNKNILILDSYKDYTTSITFQTKLKEELLDIDSEEIRNIVLEWLKILQKNQANNIANNKTAKRLYSMFDGKCAYCGVELNPDNFTIDHKNPKINGGGNEFSNLFPSCRHCNSQKSGRTINEYRLAFFNKKHKFYFEV